MSTCLRAASFRSPYLHERARPARPSGAPSRYARGKGRSGPSKALGGPVGGGKVTGKTREDQVRSLPRTTLAMTALACLSTFVLLAAAVAHGRGPYGFEDPLFTGLGAPSTTRTWAEVAELLDTPAIGVALVASIVLGLAKRAMGRVVLYAALALTAFIVSEHVAKPLVHRNYYGELTFPSGSVTAVSAIALAMWLAVSPVFEKRARIVTFIIGAVWSLLTTLAVVGALWHTPIDGLGSVLLAVGIVAGGAALVERSTPGRGSLPARPGSSA